MHDLYEKLARILKLEREKRFDNTAVIGGLEGFLTFWLSEARNQAATSADRSQVDAIAERLRGYGRMLDAERRTQIVYLLDRLGFAPENTEPPAPPPATPAPRPTPPVAPAPPRPEEDTPSPAAESRPRPAPRPAVERSRARSRPRPAETERGVADDGRLDEAITTLSGIGPKIAARYERLGIRTIRELLHHAPSRYEDYTAMRSIAELAFGDVVTLAAVVQEIKLYKSQRGTVVINARVGDGSGTLRVRWFGNRYLINQLPPGTMVRLSGKIEAYLGHLQMNSPRFEVIDALEVKEGRLVPIYPLTEGLGEKRIQKDIDSALRSTRGHLPDPLPAALREQYGLMKLGAAFKRLHQPRSTDEAQRARRRLAFDELLRVQLGLLQRRREWKAAPGRAHRPAPGVMERFIASLPFTLTGSQQRALDEILADMARDEPMSRLLQGDVGSGKTVVAAAAMLAAVRAGSQAAIMAPTEILADQHYQGIRSLLEPHDCRIVLLTGSMSSRAKAETRVAIAAGEVDMVVGTHALIQEQVEFARLGLVVVDEQHRFGVRQRGALRQKSADGSADLLVMSATPIPRSLAMTLYGDLDLSIIDEMPPGRQPIVTRAITGAQRERAYNYIRRQVIEGRQAFIICPLVEESDTLEARAAVEEHRFLQNEVFAEFSVALLHGRLRADEKEAEMARFYRNESQILVSTSVVEVGIDVPNASVMMIEGANRFGLAQLHQFRGRIGRGAHRSLCLLMSDDDMSAEGETRLQALVENGDGFALAEQDLTMRGPGDFFGTRQSGLPALTMARLGDSAILQAAREAATALLARDPDLALPEHRLLQRQTERYWAGQTSAPS